MDERLEIRTKDEVLRRALECWWKDFSCRCPERDFVITDLASFAPLGCANEITLSAANEKGALPRPFSYEELENALFEAEQKKTPRLVFTAEGARLDGRKLSLSPLEGRLLRLLDEADGPLSAKELSLRLFGEERPSNQINVYINYLRKKTDLPGKERLIRTVRNKGFYISHDR